MQQAPTQESSAAAMPEEEHLTRDLGQLIMQGSTTTVALQPASLPNLWLHKLATHVSAQLAKRDLSDTLSRSALMAVFRTCTACRDAVILSRPACIYARVSIHPEDWPGVLQQACTVLRRSRHAILLVEGSHGAAVLDWTETEPYIIHLLLCVRGKLGAAALTGIKEVALRDLHVSALVPAWLRELCPSATRFTLVCVDLPSAPATHPAPTPHHGLQQLIWKPHPSLSTRFDPIRRHVRQQLAALPSLTYLNTRDLDWAARPVFISGSVTRLDLFGSFVQCLPPPLVHLPTQFPNLTELEGAKYLVVRDDDLRALLRMLHLQRLGVFMLELQDSHRAGPWPQHLDVRAVSTSVDTLALLPLDRVPKVTMAQGLIMPSRDAARAERVAAASRRWGAFGVKEEGRVWLSFSSTDFLAFLTTLPPFLRAAPPQPAILDIVTATGMTVEKRQLAALLTPNISALQFTHAPIWPRLLPSLPPSVTVLGMHIERMPVGLPEAALGQMPSVQQVLSLCLGAVRPVTVRVTSHGGTGATPLVQRVLATMGGAPQARLVRLEAVDKH